MSRTDTWDFAIKVTEQTIADATFRLLVDDAMAAEDNPGRPEAEQIVRDNLGYFAGYYDAETRERVERLYNCQHPIFGKISEHGIPTPEEAFELGREMGSGASNVVTLAELRARKEKSA